MVHEFFGPAIIGENPLHLETLLEKLDRVAKGYPYAKASIDIALHYLIGKATSLPVYQLLGGLYRREVRLAHSLGILETKRVLEEVEAALEEGVGTIKLKVGLDPERDVNLVQQVRELIGDKPDITVDANQGWPTPKIAIQTLRRMEPYRVLFAEQPVEGLREMAQVAHAVDIPVMADESAWSARDILEIARQGAADLISLYTTKPGGLFRARKAAAVAEAAGLPCNVNGSAETGVGNAANLHLAAAMKVVKHACVIPVSAPAEALPTRIVGRSYLDDLITEPFDYRNGSLIVPDRPGLGVDLDEAKVAKYQQELMVVR
jgi:muconate cycloisomerase